jgi:hypothetical protein
MKNILKKHGSLFVWIFLFGAFLLPGSNLASAGGYQFLAPIPTNPNTGFTDLSDYMKYLYVAIVGLAIVLGVVMIVIGGIQYVTAAVPSAKEEGKKRVGGAIIGVLLAIISYVAIDALNPKLNYVGLFFPQGYNPPGNPPGGNQCNNDGTCGAGETNANCPNDCPAVCGNNVCEQGETNANCPNDCKTGDLDCKKGKCATDPTLSNAIKNNCAGVDPNFMMAIIQRGEGCNNATSKDGYGSCGYGQLLPDNRKKWCGLGNMTKAQTCAAVKADLELDICCTSKMMAAEIKRCGNDIKRVASCWNSGSPVKCGIIMPNAGGKRYCQVVEEYYNQCLK